MEFYSEDTPATHYFDGGSFNLTPNEPDRYKEVILHLTFDLVYQNLNLNVYSGLEGKYVHEFKGTNSEVEKFFTELETIYDIRIPKKFSQKSKIFLTLKNQGFGISLDLDDNPNYDLRYCEQCGSTDSNELTGFYFPKINSEHPASLAIGYDFGCFGGDKCCGELDKVKVDVEKYIESVLRFTDPEAKLNVLEFFKKVKEL
jgi:hypothetical protein